MLAVITALVLPLAIVSPVRAAPGLSVEGAVLDITLSPRESYTHTMTIASSADYTMNMRAEARGFGQSPDGSIIALPPSDDNSPYSGRTLISSIDKTSFLLDPGSSQQIQASIDIPADAAPGTRYAIIHIYSQPDSSNGVGIVVATNILVIIRIPGSEPINKGEITGLEISEIESGQPVQIETTFKNTGNIHYKVRNKVTIKDNTGQIISQDETALTSSSIIPGQSRLLTLSFMDGTNGLPPGQYIIESGVSLKDGTLQDTKETGFIVFEDGTVEIEELIAGFAANVTSGDTPLTVTFTDKSIGNPVSWAWDFDNDGNVDSTEQNPSFIYDSVDIYTVSLSITNVEGNSDTETKTGYIKVSKVLIQQMISPDKPSTVKTSDEKIIIEFLKGAVVSDSVVIIRQIPQAGNPVCPAGFKAGATCFRIDLSADLSPGTMIDITIKYSAADLEACGEDLSRLTLSRYDEDVDEWVILPTTVDREAMTLTASTDRFSTWMVMVKDQSAETEPPAEATEGTALWIWLVATVGGAGVLFAISSAIIIARRRSS